MANINKIKLSGTTYNIQDLSAAKTVELTQAQYDALVSGGTVDQNTFYVITDAQGADLSNYYTKSETSGATQISTALASKQTTLTAGTGIDITDNVISATGGGGSITIDASLDSGSTNAVANSAITNAVNSKQNTLVSGTNIKTINNESLLGSGNISLATKTELENLSNDVYTIKYGNSSTYSTAFVSRKTAYGFTVDLSNYYNINWSFRVYDSVNVNFINLSINNQGKFFDVNGNQISMPSYLDPNLTKCVSGVFSVYFNTTNYYADYFANVNALTFTIYESLTKKSSKDALGGLSLVKLTQAEYDALTTKDDNTVYFIGDSTNGYTMKIGSANVN